MKFLLWSIGAISSFHFSQRGMEMREVTKVATTMASEASNFIALVARWYIGPFTSGLYANFTIYFSPKD